MATTDEGFNAEDHYGKLPGSADDGFGPDEGYNTFVLLNDPALFTSEARADPAVREFLASPFRVYFSQWKSGYREAEHFLHQPREVLGGRVDGVKGVVGEEVADLRLVTMVMNHEEPLWIRITRSLLVEDGTIATNLVHKEPID